jgi:hypothetical protein
MSACLDCGGSECVCGYKRAIDRLTEACQIFTQALGDDSGYLPAIGATKTKRALDLMRLAKVKPLFHSEGR